MHRLPVVSRVGMYIWVLRTLQTSLRRTLSSVVTIRFSQALMQAASGVLSWVSRHISDSDSHFGRNKYQFSIPIIMKRTILFVLAAMMSFSAVAVAADFSDAVELTDKKPKKAKKVKEVKEVIFHVHLHCQDCVDKVVENISFEKGVKDLKVTLEDHTVAIKYDPAKTSEETLKAAIEKLGYPVAGKVEPGQKPEHHHDHHHHN